MKDPCILPSFQDAKQVGYENLYLPASLLVGSMVATVVLAAMERLALRDMR